MGRAGVFVTSGRGTSQQSFLRPRPVPGARACQVGHDSRACAPSRAGGSRMRVCRSPAHPRSCRGGACPGQAPPSSLGRHGASHCKCRLGAKGTSGKHTGSCRREGPRHTASCRPCAKHLRVSVPPAAAFPEQWRRGHCPQPSALGRRLMSLETADGGIAQFLKINLLDPMLCGGCHGDHKAKHLVL